MTTYHSLTPRQQRVWDAAYGAAYVHNIRCAADEAIRGRAIPSPSEINALARHFADKAAASLEDHGSHSAD